MLGEVYCRSPPPTPPASPSTGVAGWAGKPAGNLTLPGRRPTPISNPEPSWASVVRDGARATHTAVSRQDFLALYERCPESGLRTRFILRHQAVQVRRWVTGVLGIWRGEGLEKWLGQGRSVYKQPETEVDGSCHSQEGSK